jgi:glycosyltransferase involved in cell wall biosynthesis
MIPVPPDGYGGIERIVDSLAGEFRRQGHVVGLVAKAGSRCPVDSFFAWPGNDVGGLLDTMRNGWALRHAARCFCPDVIHSFSRLAYLYGVLPTGTPKLMSYQRHTGPSAARNGLRLAQRGTLQFSGCSEFICWQGRPGGGEWHAIPNFVDLKKIDFVPRVHGDAPLIFLSRVESIKGPDLAIDIAQRSGRRLLIAGNRAGSGPESRFFVEKIAPRLGHSGIEWIGEVDDVHKNRLLGEAAAMIVPVQWDEPFGIVFAEALAAGTPVITCARGALPEIIDEGCTGFFIRSVEDGVAAVRQLGELDRAMCRRVAEERFSLPVCTAHYLRLYARMIAALL